MATDSAHYLSALHKMMEKFFDLEEIQALCFELEVD